MPWLTADMHLKQTKKYNKENRLRRYHFKCEMQQIKLNFAREQYKLGRGANLVALDSLIYLLKFMMIVYDLKLLQSPKLTNVIAQTDERKYQDAALDSVGKHLGIDRWCIHLEVERVRR